MPNMPNEEVLVNTGNKNNDVDTEAKRILEKNVGRQKSTFEIQRELKAKYKDDETVKAIMTEYKDKLDLVIKYTDKIKKRLLENYPNLSMKEYIAKITGYGVKYNLDDAVVQSIIKTIFLNKTRPSIESHINPNEMSKALGFVPISSINGDSLYVRDDEQNQLKVILNMAVVTKELHNQVIMQSVIYDSLDMVNLATVGFDKSKINIFSFVHPVIAALFIPKFNILDEHMLLASIAKIITLKYNNNNLEMQPEYELYWDIATDPAEMACVQKSAPFTDLVSRCNVQTKLWESVLNLRQGKFYRDDLSSFILAIDMCKGSVFDAADFAYIKDEGTIIRKLFSAFSLRTTIVVTTPINNLNPSFTSHLSTLTTQTATTISMITMRLPISLTGSTNSVDIESAMSQTQLYIHHKVVTMRTQEILYSKELLVFYVHRRSQNISDFTKLTQPYHISFLPVTMTQFEKLHDSVVTFKFKDLKFGNQTFNLASFVAVEVAPPSATGVESSIIISCSAVIACEYEGVDSFLYYNPLDLSSSKDNKIHPISFINPTMMSKTSEEWAADLGQKKGTLFIYKEEKPTTP